MLTVEEVASVCHEANRAYCAALGDGTQVPWEHAPEWQRDSAINGVVCRHSHPDDPPAASHTAWLAQKVQEGWVYRPIKDPLAKTHVCCRPFDELPIEQQRKDFLFCAIVDALRPLLEPIEVLSDGSWRRGRELTQPAALGDMIPSTSDARTINNMMRHQYKVLTEDEKSLMQHIKDRGLDLWNVFDGTGTSRELSLAKTKVEEAVMWAVKHVTR